MGIGEAIEQRRWEGATEQIDRLAETLRNLADEIRRAEGLVLGARFPVRTSPRITGDGDTSRAVRPVTPGSAPGPGLGAQPARRPFPSCAICNSSRFTSLVTAMRSISIQYHSLR